MPITAEQICEENRIDLRFDKNKLKRDSSERVYVVYPDGSMRRVIGATKKGKSPRSLLRDAAMVARYNIISNK